jgi:hypothetical protein
VPITLALVHNGDRRDAQPSGKAPHEIGGDRKTSATDDLQ